MKDNPRAQSTALTPTACLELIDIEELAVLLRVRKGTIYNWVHRRKIPFVKVGRLVRFDPVEIAKYLDGCRMGPLAGKG